MSTILANFLRTLADKMDKKLLSKEEELKVVQLYASLLLDKNEQLYSEEEMYKFLTLGWYIHTQVKNNLGFEIIEK